MARGRAPRSRGPAFARLALVVAVLAAGPGVSAVAVMRSMSWRARPYLLRPARPEQAPVTASRRDASRPTRLRLGLNAAALPAVVAQSTPRSCGPAALATVLAWRGRPVGEAAVLAQARLREGGASLAEMSRLAEAFELPGSWYAVPRETLARLPTPFIAHLRAGGGHYVAVWRVARGFVLLADPAVGLVLERAGRFRRAWSGRVLLFEAAAGSPR